MWGTNFAEGWLCSLYKKDNKTNIGYYRPITVLNSDYKIMTKVLTFRLSEAVSHIIYINQAGFMKRCKIDQTELAYMAIEWCSTTEINRLLVCLDQKKYMIKYSTLFCES